MFTWYTIFGVRYLLCNGHMLLFQPLQPKLVFGGLRMEQLCGDIMELMLRIQLQLILTDFLLKIL